MRDFVARRVRLSGASPTVALMARGIELKEQGRDILNFAGGEPDFDTPETIKLAGIRAIRENQTHYTSAAGILAVRERIARKLREENGVRVGAEGIIVTPGAKLALFQAMMAFLEEGDECMALTPAYPSYRAGVLLTGAEFVPVPLRMEDGFRVTRQMLEEKASPRSKMLIVCNPCNPTGHVLSREEIDDIAAFARAHEILVISDEIYEKLVYDGRIHYSLGAVEDIADRVITLNGLSKCAAMTGWRVGYSAACPELTGAMLKLQTNTVNCTAAFTQLAAARALDCAEETAAMTAIYARRRDLICDGLNDLPGVCCPRAEGAFYAFFRMDYRGMDSAQLCEHILEQTGVMLVPGTAFGEGGESCIRLSFAADTASLEAALERMRRAFG